MQDPPPGGGEPEPVRRESLPLLQLVPNLMTITGLCAGLTALRFALQGRFELAVALVILAALLDGFDGLVARKLNAATRFGAELDSLADFVNFGVAPALIVYALALSGAPDAAWTAPLVFAVCACLRLARFNVNRDVPLTGTAHFIGVPAPAGAILAMLPAYLDFADIADPAALPALVAAWLVCVGLLMICRLRTPALKAVRIPREKARWFLVALVLVIGFGISRLWLVMIVGAVTYLAALAWAALAARRFPHNPET